MRALTRLLGAALAFALAAGAGAATAQTDDAPFDFDKAPGRLPKSVVPIHYAIALKPDLDALRHSGSMTVEIEVREATRRIVLNALDLAIERAVLDDDPALAASVELDPERQTATLAFDRPIAPGRHVLALAFSGRINPFGRGLFYADYPTDRGQRRMIATHLEPADARRIFPSWDEPAFKARYTLSVVVPTAHLAVANMPVEAEEPVNAATKRVRFATTPRMSSYLFVLASGELERVSREVAGVTLGVVVQKAKTADARYALDSAAQLLPWLEDYFGIPYGLPKLDLIALPGGFRGAMENWGGITFFEPLILFDPATSPETARRRLFATLAHELAHQWFGNHVTMGWWDNLWLNEGFASWMENKATEALHPEWRVWLNQAGGKQSAMAQDARRSTHPIQQPVANESEAMQVFDGITYRKGQAFIRMLESWLGPDAFREGIGRYLRRHALGNATTADLWRALAESSGKDVAALAASYTRQPGVPLVVGESRCVDGGQRLVLRQERFTLNDPAAASLRWPVPVELGIFASPPRPRSVLLDGAAEIEAGSCGDAVKLNLGDVGYYRVLYDARAQEALAAVAPAMTPEDRVNLLADAWALAEGGRAPPERFLQLLGRLSPDDHRAVWETVANTLSRIQFLERGRPERPSFLAFARRVLRPAFERLGWDVRPGEPTDDGLLRVRLIRALGELGDAAVLAEAGRRFDRFVADAATLPADLRGSVTQLAGRIADRERYDTLLRLARATTSTEERQRYYYALASAHDPALAGRTMAMTLEPDFPAHMTWMLLGTVVHAGGHIDRAWDFVRANYDRLAATQDQAFRDMFVPDILASYPDRRYAEAIRGFAPASATPGGRIASERAVARILADVEQRERLLPAIDAWIAAAGP